MQFDQCLLTAWRWVDGGGPPHGGVKFHFIFDHYYLSQGLSEFDHFSLFYVSQGVTAGYLLKAESQLAALYGPLYFDQ